MIRTLLLLTLLLSLSGCDDDAENARKTAASQAEKVTQISWDEGLPENQLASAAKSCHSTGASCTNLMEQLQEIKNGISSCTDGSRLCRAIAKYVTSESPLLPQLPHQTAIVAMPTHPFYYNIGNDLLDSQSSRFGYRTEIWWSWWLQWKLIVIAAMATLALFGCVWRCTVQILTKVKVKAESVAKAARQTDLMNAKEEENRQAAKAETELEVKRQAAHAAAKRLKAQHEAEAETQAQEKAMQQAIAVEARAEAEAQREIIKAETAAALAAAFKKRR